VITCPSCGQENPEVAKFCLNCATPLQPKSAPREVRKTVTVVFSDVSGSTSLGERLDPESMRRVMSRYFEEMKAALESHGGTVEKFIGDAVMAVFGIPTLHEDDALRALRAADEMRERLDRLNQELERDRGVQLLNRTGVNTGEVVAGDPSASQTLVTGDAVNVAARLEQTAQPGEILIGDTTYRLTRDDVRVEPLDPLDLKGKADAIKAYRLVEVLPSTPGVVRRLDSPMVGRDRQLSALTQAFDDAVADPACHLFTILGSAGVGKSRLVKEFIGGVERHATVLRGRCLPYGEGITFWPVREFVQAAAGILDTDPLDEALQKVAKLVHEDDDRDDIAQQVGQAMGLAPAISPSEEIFWAVRKLLESQARDRPLVVVIDDIHWAEPTLLDLIEHVADWSRDAPILLVCVARPELLDQRSTWGGGKLHASSVLLEPLSEAECEGLIENLLGHAHLDQPDRARIAEAAEGNPLFVEEMIGMLIDDGILHRENGHWTPTSDLSKVSVPPTIQALLAARLDRLDHEERQVIERASVVGKIFYRGAVAELSPEAVRSHVGPHLMTLVRKELIRPDRPAFGREETYRFRHILIRDAAYQGIAKEARADLHEAFAKWLGTAAGPRASEYEEILGYHLEQSYRYRSELGPVDRRAQEVGARAAGHLATAGRKAMGRFDQTAASSLLERATNLLSEDSTDRLALLVDLGLALMDSGDFTRADQVLNEAIEQAQIRGDRAIEQRARLIRADRPDLTTPIADLVKLARDAIPILEELNDDLGLSMAWQIVAWGPWGLCRAGEAEHAFLKALEYARRASSPRDIAKILHFLDACLVWGPTPAGEALERSEQILAEARGNRLVEGSVHLGRAIFLAMLGRFNEARDAESHGLRMIEELGRGVVVAMLGSGRAGLAEELIGDLDRAEEIERRGFQELERLGEKGLFSTLAGQLAEIVYRRGRYDEAERLSKVSEDASAADDLASQIGWRAVRAKVLARRGEFEEAERLAREAVTLGEETDFLNVPPRAFEALAEVLGLAGRRDEAAQALEEAALRYERKGNIVSTKRVREALDELKASP
jgi:class 3 adenylate cyclase/tetratricopeptide (TPR) repeat protein